jgi:hypothetical protein
MTNFETVITSSAITGACFAAVVWMARNLILERLRAAVRHEYDARLEVLRSDLSRQTETGLTELRSQLEREAADKIARLQSELDLLKAKELSGLQEKLNAYRLVIEVFAEIYSDLLTAFSAGQFAEVRDRYNRFWVRCYGYLSVVAPQEVMDAYDGLNDYVLGVLSGRRQPQPWSESRVLALRFINSMRDDVGLADEDIEYHGEF